jgi:hypothetical protein
VGPRLCKDEGDGIRVRSYRATPGPSWNLRKGASISLWLDRAVELAKRHQLQVPLCTPTLPARVDG